MSRKSSSFTRGKGRERLLSEHNVSERQLGLALSYREAYPYEIDEALEENARTPEEWHEVRRDTRITGVTT